MQYGSNNQRQCGGGGKCSHAKGLPYLQQKRIQAGIDVVVVMISAGLR